jgi:hypothetical protein
LLDELVPSVPRFVARTIQRMIAKAPTQRFASMAEVAQALRGDLARYLEEAKGSARAPRRLWLAPLVVPQPESRADTSDAITEVHERMHCAPTAPAAARATPLVPAAAAVPPITPYLTPRSPLSLAGARPGPVATAPAAAAAMPAPLHAAAPDMMTDAAPAAHQFMTELSAHHPQYAVPSCSEQRSFNRAPTSRSALNALDRFCAAVCVGLVAGVGGGLVAYWPTPSPAGNQVEEPVALRAVRRTQQAEPPPPPIAASKTTDGTTTPPPMTATPPDVARAVPSASATSAPNRVTAATKKARAPVAALASQTTHANPAPKLPAAAATGGLWDMSDLHTPAKPSPTATATAKPRQTAVY